MGECVFEPLINANEDTYLLSGLKCDSSADYGLIFRENVVKYLNLLFILCGTVSANAQDAPTEFDYPLAVTETADGIVYVADRNLPGIWKVEDGKKSIYFQGSKKFRTPLNAVRCLAIDHEGKLLAGDSSTREVYRFDDDAKPQPLTEGWIGIPMALAVAPDGTIYTADLENAKRRREGTGRVRSYQFTARAHVGPGRESVGVVHVQQGRSDTEGDAGGQNRTLRERAPV